MDNNKKSVETYQGLEYIKSIISKSEMGYVILQKMIMGVAATFFVGDLVINIIYAIFFRDIKDHKELLGTLLISCLVKIIILIILLFILKKIGRELKQDNYKYAIWLYYILCSIIVIGGIMLPVLSMAVDTTNATANIMKIFTVTLCMQVCGVFIGSKKVRMVSYLYFLIPFVIIVVMGFWSTYNQAITEDRASAIYALQFSQVFIYIQLFFYDIYTLLGFLYIAKILKKENERELQ